MFKKKNIREISQQITKITDFSSDNGNKKSEDDALSDLDYLFNEDPLAFPQLPLEHRQKNEFYDQHLKTGEHIDSIPGEIFVTEEENVYISEDSSDINSGDKDFSRDYVSDNNHINLFENDSEETEFAVFEWAVETESLADKTFPPPLSSKNDSPTLPFEEPPRSEKLLSVTAGGGSDNKSAFTNIAEIRSEIKQRRDFVEFDQQFESKRHQMTWEMFLVMQLAGRVAYLTKGQMHRYLVAWKKYFEPDIKADMGVIQTLVRKRWLTRTSKPVVFSRGDLKGQRTFPYVMTRNGRQAFGKFDVETANLARIGEPEGKMFDRLEHELLISEVYIHLIEQSNFIYWFISEENMRREIVQNIWKRWRQRENTTLRNNRLGDFKICYFDKTTGDVEMREGEIAVRYKRGQIMLKSDDLWWFCYSDAEAEKIKLIKGKDAVVLTDSLYSEVIKPHVEKRNQRNDKKKNDGSTAQWAKALGGLTVQTGALLTGLKYLAIWRRLKHSPDYKMYMTAFQPGAGAGRPICFYTIPEILDSAEKRREAFVLNLGLEVLIKKGFTVTVEDSFVSVFDEKKKEMFHLVADSTFFSTAEEWKEIVPNIEQKVGRGRKKKMKTIILVADQFNIYRYQSSFPDEIILDLNEHF